MKRALISLCLSLGVAVLARPVCAATQWVVVPLIADPDYVMEFDLNSVQLVEREVYQYRTRILSEKGWSAFGRQWSYFYSYDKVDCANNLATTLSRFNGPRGDKRVHEGFWSTWSARGSLAKDYESSFVCQYVQKNAIPTLEPNWDLKPESYLEFADQ